MAKKFVSEEWAWRGALALIGLLVSFLFKELSAPLNVSFPELVKALSLGIAGVAGAVLGSAGLQQVLGSIRKMFASDPKTNENPTRRVP